MYVWEYQAVPMSVEEETTQTASQGPKVRVINDVEGPDSQDVCSVII